MRYQLLGNSGLRVSELCLGTMTFGDDFGWGADYATSRTLFDTFLAAGGNFIDTANEIYTGGTSESYLGEFIASQRDLIVLATKYTDSLPTNDPNQAGNHRKNMRQSVERSLRRLKTDYIDLLWLHAWDFMTPVEEVMRGLDDLIRAGKVLYIGVSDTPAWVVAQANTIAQFRGWTAFIGVQVFYSLVEHTADRELLPMAQALGLGVLGWSPLASGLLTGKYHATAAATEEPKRLDTIPFVERNERNLAIANTVQRVAQELGRSPAQVALNWVRQRGVLPIIGARKLSQLQDNLACLDFTIPPAAMTQLNSVSAIDLGFPTDFLTITQGATYGGTLDLIDWPRAGTPFA